MQSAAFERARVLILTGEFRGNDGLCLGRADGLWAVLPEKDFRLLVDLSSNPTRN
jgi:hypothetical protein